MAIACNGGGPEAPGTPEEGGVTPTTASPTPAAEADLEANLEQIRDDTSGAVCADQRNDIFRIDSVDGTLAFWIREGSCADFRYTLTLHDLSTRQVLCTVSDSIAGPRETCEDGYNDLFQTLKANTEEVDLGLGADYEVQEVYRSIPSQ
jgi:hypothetical protein